MENLKPLRAAHKLLASKPKGEYVLVAFEEPLSEPTEKRISYYEFHVIHRDEFITNYCGAKCVRRYHEAIMPLNECAFYQDIEFEGEAMVGAEAKLQTVLALNAEQFEKRLCLKHFKPPIITEATTPKKFSVHVIYSTIWMETPGHVLDMIRDIPYVDKAPYPTARTGTNRWMRMTFSEKLTKKNPLLPRGNSGWKLMDGSIDPDIFCSSLISWKNDLTHTSVHGSRLPSPERVYSVVLSDAGSNYARRECTDDSDVIARGTAIMDYLRMTRGHFNYQQVTPQSNGGWQTTISPPLFCPLKGGTHKSHNMYIGSYDNVHVYARCADTDCRVTVYFSQHCFDPLSFPIHVKPRPVTIEPENPADPDSECESEKEDET